MRIALKVLLLVSGASLGLAYAWALRLVAAMYCLTGHGDDTALKILSIPHWGKDCLVPLLFGLSFVAWNRWAAATGAITAGAYLLSIWAEDAFGLLRFFKAPLASVFVAVFHLHILLISGMLIYFVACACSLVPFPKSLIKPNAAAANVD